MENAQSKLFFSINLVHIYHRNFCFRMIIEEFKAKRHSNNNKINFVKKCTNDYCFCCLKVTFVK